MPCRYDPTPEEERRWAEERNEALKKAWLEEFKPKLDELTKLLCEACQVIIKTNTECDVSPELTAWWLAHQEEDAKREAKESQERVKKKKDLLRKSIANIDDEKMLDEILARVP